MTTKTMVAELAELGSAPLVEAIEAARYMVDVHGDKTDVVLPLPIWEKLLDWLEDIEDRALVQAWLPKLKQGPQASGALKWNDVAEEWADDEPV